MTKQRDLPNRILYSFLPFGIPPPSHVTTSSTSSCPGRKCVETEIYPEDTKLDFLNSEFRKRPSSGSSVALSHSQTLLNDAAIKNVHGPLRVPGKARIVRHHADRRAFPVKIGE